MEDTASSNAQDAVNNKSNEANKERPKSLDLESSNFGNEEELDDTKATTRSDWHTDQFFNACGLRRD